MATNIGNMMVEQTFAMILIFCAALFDLILIILFILSFTPVAPIAVVIQEIADPIFGVTLGIILLLMGASKYALKKTEQIMAPTEENQPLKIKQQKERAEAEKNNTTKETPAINEINATPKQNNPVTTLSNAPPGASPKTRELPMQAVTGQGEGQSKGAQTKSAGKQAGQEAIKGGLQAGAELASGDVKGAAKTTAKTGLKIGVMFLWLGISLLLGEIPYAEVVPWYTIWAIWVWFKITFAEVKNTAS